MLAKIDWVGDDGLFDHQGRTASIERIGLDLFEVSGGDDDEEQTIVGAVALDYWLHRLVHR